VFVINNKIMKIKSVSLKESDVFISYGRAESKTFATKLYNQLSENGYEVWFDQNDIPLGVDFQTQIDEGILKAKNFIFIIAPHSLKSEYCLKEIKLAVKNNKRIIPILHVEPTTKEVWNMMHSTISKLNWIYCREKFEINKSQDNWEQLDDFKKGFDALLQLLVSNNEYVTKHRDYLVKAINWDRNQQDTNLLLINEEQKESEQWLKTDFNDQQPPCLPTDLHCQYITESKENSNNNLTDIFFSYSANDKAILNKIYLTLIRKAFTTWIKESDLKPGSNLQKSCFEAIEKSSNFVIFISNQTLKSKQNQDELNYALKLNKRIIPIKIENVDENIIPEDIKKLFFLDYSNIENNDNSKDFDKLISILNKDFFEFDLHKQILIKALEWERNNYEIKFLLRGFNLENAKEWLVKSSFRKEYNPTILQKKYIDESKKTTITAFISYARKPSKDFATKLYNELTNKNFDVWFDQNNFPLALDFQEHVNNGIQKSDNFIFIISPNSIKSPYCKIEIELAIKYNKRIIPIVHEMPIENSNEINPIITKINWIYFRENIDNFENSFNGLVTVLEKYSKYLKQHTNLLINALNWEKNHFDEKLLLSDNKLIVAEKWLSSKFENEVPPCLPTNLHADFILKSRKQNNHQYSDVFLSYAEENIEIRNKIYFALAKEGIAAADNTNYSIKSDFTKANHEAIEKADNIIFFVSKKSLKTDYCLEEISHALIFEKRIILIMIEYVENSELFEELQNIDYIDFTDNLLFEKQVDKLLNEINIERNYFFLHKYYLSNAIEWKKQNSNKAMLLNGFELEKAKIWLNEAENKTKNFATPIQIQFINESAKENINYTPEIYISNSNFENDFANKLNFKLKSNGKTTWHDAENIPNNLDYYQEIKKGISQSDNCLFIFSPNILNKNNFIEELNYVKELNKRIILIDYEEVDKIELPKELLNLNFINFNPDKTDFNVSFSELLRSVDVDREYIQTHNRWAKRTNEWIENKNSDDLLLRGTELELAKNWLSNSLQNNKNPKPTTLQTNFINSSFKLELKIKKREQRIYNIKKLMTFIMGFLMIISLILGIIATKQSKISKNLLKDANIQRLKLLTQDVEKTDPTKALRIAQEALLIDSSLNTMNLIYEIYKNNIFYKNIQTADEEISYFALSNDNQKYIIVTGKIATLYNNENIEISKLIGHTDLINKIDFSPENDKILTCSDDGTVILWNFDGKIVREYECNSNSILSVKFSPDGKYFLTGNADYTAKLWNIDGDLIKTFSGHSSAVWDIAFSPDGKNILTGSFDYTAKLWNLEGKNIQTYKGHNNIILSVDFSESGKYILTAADDETAIVWNLDGSIKTKIQIADTKIYSAKFSNFGSKIITTNNNNSINIWSLDGYKIATLNGHTSDVYYAITDNYEKYLYSCSKDKTLKKWYLDGLENFEIETNSESKSLAIYSDSIIWYNETKNLVKFNLTNNTKTSFTAHKSMINDIAISLNKKFIVTVGEDNMAFLWDSDGNIIKELKHHEDAIWAAEFTPDNKKILTVSQDFVIAIWDTNGNLLKTIETETSVLDLAISPDGKNFITANEDMTSTLWTIDGVIINTFRGHSKIVSTVTFSPDGKTIATGSYDNTIKLWNLEGRQLHTLNLHTDKIMDLKFTNDGNYLISASSDKKCMLWDLNGNCLKIYEKHKEAVQKITVCNDNESFISISKDGTIKNWDLRLSYYNFDFEYENISIAEKIEYNLITDDEIENFTDKDDIISASQYFENKAVLQIDNSKKLENQEKAVQLLKNLRNIDEFENDTLVLNKLSLSLNTLSYNYLLNNNYEKALKTAKSAFELTPNQKIIYSNLALAFLLNNETNEAKAIYNKFKDEMFNDKLTFKQLFLGDLMNLEQIGIYNEKFEEIYEILK